jgi:hypothetical protein
MVWGFDSRESSIRDAVRQSRPLFYHLQTDSVTIDVVPDFCFQPPTQSTKQADQTARADSEES